MEENLRVDTGVIAEQTAAEKQLWISMKYPHVIFVLVGKYAQP